MKMTHSDKAAELFKEGYTCAQAVLLAFSDITGIDEETASKIALSFGGGMGRLREVCGTVSGALMTAGLLWAPSGKPPYDAKAKHYELVQEIAKRFKEKNGSIICRELLGLNHKTDPPVPEKRTEDYYKRRPCEKYVRISAEIIEQLINEKSV